MSESKGIGNSEFENFPKPILVCSLAPDLHMLSFVKNVLLAIGILTSLPCYGQDAEKHIRSREQIWFGYFNQTRLSDKLGLWFDIHYRRTDHFVDRHFQFLVRPALMYHINENVRVNIGYTFASHFPGKNFQTTRIEHRPWQQIAWNQRYNGFTTLQTVRLEQRFDEKIVADKKTGGFNYTFRTRYNFSFSIPLKGRQILPKTPFMVLANEVMLNFGKNVVYNTFDQNRMFGGFGYQFTTNVYSLVGYMNVYQQETTGNNYSSTHAIRFYLYQTLDFRREHKDAL